MVDYHEWRKTDPYERQKRARAESDQKEKEAIKKLVEKYGRISRIVKDGKIVLICQDLNVELDRDTAEWIQAVTG